MGLLARFFKGKGHGVDELARRLGLPGEQLQSTRVAYREFTIPKRNGGQRRITAPEPELKAVQRAIHRRLLKRLRTHPAATAYQHGSSIVTNAVPHVGRRVVVCLDLHEFFATTKAARIRSYFQAIGWNRPASALLTQLCTHEDGLPQGAPTSPLLSNLVNIRMDARLTGLARTHGAVYTRYADDMTFSFEEDNRGAVRGLVGLATVIAREHGYWMHGRKKRRIRRQYEQQRVTGLVVNERVNLPRSTRRRLRAIAHHLDTGQPATLTEEQLAGWNALTVMIERQRYRS